VVSALAMSTVRGYTNCGRRLGALSDTTLLCRQCLQERDNGTMSKWAMGYGAMATDTATAAAGIARRARIIVTTTNYT
jgi:hypothetical protein